MGIFLYIDVDAFFASVEQSINRSLIGRPVMVGGLKHERGVVACPSYEARARGVRTGTPLYEAARRIPDGVFLRGDFHRYQYYSERFYEILNRYSPELQRISQDEACLDIAGAIRAFGGARQLAGELQNDIWRELALSTSIGVAPSRVASKIASEYKKPMGLTILEPENINEFFVGLPIRKIPGVGHTTEKILHEMGIRTAGQLAAVPEHYLKTVFGINGLKIAAYSRGEDGIPLRDYKAIRSVSRETGFADDITDRNVLLSHFYYLLERAASKLRQLSKKSGTVRIKFRYADFQTVEASSRIHPASNDQNSIFPIIQNMFVRTFTRRQGIRLVGVTLSGLKNYIDNATFLDDRIEKDRRLLQGLDFARDKAGFFAVTTGRTLSLASRYKRGDTGYELRTPSLSQ
ncbi:MAG: DNA polymerase IV [candidate division Zixibacteria bacterium HGW-Zixibacteria-1]|nr:MAG: DNA polymerase IV [candidate division Zixibacteria bacterium HGW-Zixibacteria-1]